MLGALPWLLGVERTPGVSLRLVLWNAQVRIVRWGIMGPVPRHLSESGLAMQMLVMHREDNHQQPRPVQVVETAGNQKRRAEKVRWEVARMTSTSLNACSSPTRYLVN